MTTSVTSIYLQAIRSSAGYHSISLAVTQNSPMHIAGSKILIILPSMNIFPMRWTYKENIEEDAELPVLPVVAIHNAWSGT